MAELIDCRSCDSPYCIGCNLYTLATMLHKGKLNCLMNEHRSIAIDPESLRPTGEWIEHEFEEEPCSGSEYECSVCGMYQYDNTYYCPNCGANMKGETECSS